MAHSECKKYVTCPMCKGAGRNISRLRNILMNADIYFLIKIIIFKKGMSATRAATETISLSVQHENVNSSQVAKMQFVEAAYSGASGDLRFPTLSDRYIGHV